MMNAKLLLRQFSHENLAASSSTLGLPPVSGEEITNYLCIS